MDTISYSVTVGAAELLMRTLYLQLFAGSDLSTAIRKARTELYNYKERRAYFDQHIDLEDWLLPVVYQSQLVQFQYREFTLEERSAYNKRKLDEKLYAPPEPLYGFVGRDLDILQIEKRLLAQRNILLIRGMGGAGKTTLLEHLRSWWHMTGFVQQTFYFGYDERAWTLQQILTDIAQQLYGRKYYTDIQPFAFEEQQRSIAERLHAEQHLLILDNLESITGTNLAILHTLPAEEQRAIRSFLAVLTGGQTLVLLGSRGDEAWLSAETFANNVYDLAGLDPEAASILADKILERLQVTKYREDENLRHLLKLLDGFPLALEVVLSNLTHQTPSEILVALQVGDVTIDLSSDTEEKTKSILHCIDYSYRNLSPEAQTLLSCLAPFTSVVLLHMLGSYITCLKQQPILTSLPFDHWNTVIQEAQHWGLLSPHPDEPLLLRLQPMFSYFLRSRFYNATQKSVQQAIETAFGEHYNH